MNHTALTAKINSYFAVLLVTIAGAGAALLIIHVAYSNTFVTMTVGASQNGLTQ
jgi:hypothetical protein